MSPELAALLAKARDYQMTPAELAAQRRSWVVGEMLLVHPEMTREDVEKLIDSRSSLGGEHI